MLKYKILKRAFSIIMTSVFCMVAFAQTLHADEYALKGTKFCFGTHGRCNLMDHQPDDRKH